MSSDAPSPELLRRVAADPQLPFALGREGWSGTPTLWRELLVYRRGQAESYCTIRSTVDEGGDPIGQWIRDATPELGAQLLAAFEKAEPWRIPSEAISPGQNATTWSYQVGPVSGEVTLRANSRANFALRELDTLMRRIAHWLLEARLGACLCCHVVHEAGSNRFGMAISNPGTVDALVPNPMLGPWGKQNFLRFELAAPVQDPDPTGLGLIFSSLPTRRLDVDDPAWSLPVLRLPAGGKKFALPVEARFDTPPARGSWLRAVFSNYTQPVVDPPNPNTANRWPTFSGPVDDLTIRPRAAVVFGRAFSEEVLL